MAEPKQPDPSHEEGEETMNIYPTADSGFVKRTSPDALPASTFDAALPRRLKFLVRENGAILDVPLRERLTIGRRGSTSRVDVDLADHEAHDLGVSRQHCAIEVNGDYLLIRDLGSANGSRLNGDAMEPQRGYQINHGDLLKLGRMHLLVFFIGDAWEEML